MSQETKLFTSMKNKYGAVVVTGIFAATLAACPQTVFAEENQVTDIPEGTKQEQVVDVINQQEETAEVITTDNNIETPNESIVPLNVPQNNEITPLDNEEGRLVQNAQIVYEFNNLPVNLDIRQEFCSDSTWEQIKDMSNSERFDYLKNHTNLFESVLVGNGQSAINWLAYCYCGGDRNDMGSFQEAVQYLYLRQENATGIALKMRRLLYPYTDTLVDEEMTNGHFSDRNDPTIWHDNDGTINETREGNRIIWRPSQEFLDWMFPAKLGYAKPYWGRIDGVSNDTGGYGWSSGMAMNYGKYDYYLEADLDNGFLVCFSPVFKMSNGDISYASRDDATIAKINNITYVYDGEDFYKDANQQECILAYPQLAYLDAPEIIKGQALYGFSGLQEGYTTEDIINNLMRMAGKNPETGESYISRDEVINIGGTNLDSLTYMITSPSYMPTDSAGNRQSDEVIREAWKKYKVSYLDEDQYKKAGYTNPPMRGRASSYSDFLYPVDSEGHRCYPYARFDDETTPYTYEWKSFGYKGKAHLYLDKAHTREITEINKDIFDKDGLATIYIVFDWDPEVITVQYNDENGNKSSEESVSWRDLQRGYPTEELNQRDGSSYAVKIKDCEPTAEYTYFWKTDETNSSLLGSDLDSKTAINEKFFIKYLPKTDIRKITLTRTKGKPVDYSISYSVPAIGGQEEQTNTVQFNIESSNIPLVKPVIQGYSFNGWYDSNNSKIEDLNPQNLIHSGKANNLALFANLSKNEIGSVSNATITNGIPSAVVTNSNGDILEEGKDYQISVNGANNVIVQGINDYMYSDNVPSEAEIITTNNNPTTPSGAENNHSNENQENNNATLPTNQTSIGNSQTSAKENNLANVSGEVPSNSNNEKSKQLPQTSDTANSVFTIILMAIVSLFVGMITRIKER